MMYDYIPNNFISRQYPEQYCALELLFFYLFFPFTYSRKKNAFLAPTINDICPNCRRGRR